MKSGSAVCLTPRCSGRKTTFLLLLLSLSGCGRPPNAVHFHFLLNNQESVGGAAAGRSESRHGVTHFLRAAIQMLISCLTALLIPLVFNHPWLIPGLSPPLVWIICSLLRGNQ